MQLCLQISCVKWSGMSNLRPLYAKALSVALFGLCILAPLSSSATQNRQCEEALRAPLSARFMFASASPDQLPPRKFTPINILLAQSITPKSWTQQEQRLLSEIIDRLGTLNLDDFFSRIFSLNYGRVLRLETLIDNVGGHFVPVRAWGGFSYVYDGLFISDSFFDPKHKHIQVPGGHSFKDYIVLHELAHAFDGYRKIYSSSSKFLELTGWVAQDSEANVIEWVYSGAIEEERQSIKNEVHALIDAGQYGEAYALSHKWANQRGLPSRYATESPEETFAECVTYLVLDPHAEDYMSPELVSWLREYVLH